MKTIKVVAAIFEKDSQILIAKRLKGEFAGLWEFPGGKIEPGETMEQAIIREIKEEFETDISVKEYLITVEHDYSSFHLSMDCMICEFINDDIHLNDHSDYKWIDPYEERIEWVPADVKVIEAYRYRKNEQ